MKQGYDRFIDAGPPADLPDASEVGEVLQTLRGHRRALLEYCDQAKDCQMTEPDEETACQMEPIVQSLTGSLYQIDKAIPMLEKVQANVSRYPGVVAEAGGVILSVREQA